MSSSSHYLSPLTDNDNQYHAGSLSTSQSLSLHEPQPYTWSSPPLSPHPDEQSSLDSLLYDFSREGHSSDHADQSSSHIGAQEAAWSHQPYRGVDSGSTVAMEEADPVSHLPQQATDKREGRQQLPTPERVQGKKTSVSREHFNEPQFLANLPYSGPPITSDKNGKRIVFRESGMAERELINNQVFDGKLKWVASYQIPREALHHHKLAVFKPSRVLPFVMTPSSEHGLRC